MRDAGCGGILGGKVNIGVLPIQVDEGFRLRVYACYFAFLYLPRNI